MRYAKRPRVGRKPVQRRKVYAKRRVPRPVPNGGTNILKICRTTYLENWTPNTTTTAGFFRYYQFTPNLIGNWQDYFNLFDQYKICALKFTFRPRYDSFAGNDTTDTTLPGITAQGLTSAHIINDPYSTLSPSGTYTFLNFNAFLEQGKVKSYTGTKPFSVYFKPTINLTTEAGNNMRRRASWLNVTNNNVHNGFYIFLQDVNFTGVFNQSYDVFVTSYVMLRNAR